MMIQPRKTRILIYFYPLFLILPIGSIFSCSKEVKQIPLRTAIELNVGESGKVKLSNGEVVNINLHSLSDSVDELKSAIRLAKAKVLVNGIETQVNISNYNLPVEVGNVRIDCPVSKAYLHNSTRNSWGLEKDARFRIWPKDSPFVAPGTFFYPIRQRFLSNDTQTGNEPVYVDGGEKPGNKSVYYHTAFDFGGLEGKDEVVSSVDGIVITAGEDSLPGYNDKLDGPGYDAIYVLDNRGWFHGYFHLFSIDSAIYPGGKVKMGQKIGLLGKEGASGGWAHLHYEIICKQPSGKWGFEDTYPYLWEAYTRQYKPAVIAVARPHHFAPTGVKVTLDGSKSKSLNGDITRYEWRFSDGITAIGSMQEQVYTIPGTYSEVLKVTDLNGNIDYDYTVVQVVDKNQTERFPPAIHAAYYPTSGIKVGDTVVFGVRTFGIKDGNENWDFGDGSPTLMTKSEIPDKKREGEYAKVVHIYKNPGHYLARVERKDKNGHIAIAHLHVEIEQE